MANQESYSFLQGGGEMGALTRSYPWETTSIGPPETWPQSLRTTIGILLNSKFPMFLFWGDDSICFYNDAYWPSLGNESKHPASLGMRATEVWPEIWSTIGPLIESIRTGGESNWSEDQLLPIYRNGKLEDVYWTYSYSPVQGESGKVEGVLVVCTETTQQIKTLHLLQNSDQRFQNLVREATVGIIVLMGTEMRVAIVNDAYGKLIGLTPAELMGKPLFSLIPDAEAMYRPFLENVLNSGDPAFFYDSFYEVEVKGNRINGWLNLVYQPYRESDGTITGVMALCHDVTDAVKIRKKLEESELQLRSIVESAPFPIGVYTGREMRIRLANQNIIDVWGKGTDVVGKLYSEVLPELAGQQIYEQLDGVFMTGEPFHARNQRVDLVVDGKLQDFYFNYSFTPLFDTAGKVYGVMNTAAEVTDLNRALRRSEESDLFVRSIIENSPVAKVVFVGKDMEISMVNERMLVMLGRDHSIVGKPFIEAIPDLKEMLLERLQHVLKTGETHYQPEEKIELARFGKPYSGYYNYTYKALPNTAGELYGVIVTATEVTDLVLARKAVEDTEAALRVAVELSELGTWNLDPATRMLYYSERLNEWFGFGNTPHTAEEVYERILPEYHDLVRNAMNHALEPGSDGMYDVEYVIAHRKTGRQRLLHAQGKALANPDGTIYKVEGMAQDVTEQRKAQSEMERLVQERTEELQAVNEELIATNEELGEANNQLVQSNRELEEFSYAASHDMQEPLRKIQTFSSFLLDNHADQLNEKGRSFLNKIGTSVARMKTIIDDLLRYSHQTREHQVAEPTDLNVILQNIEADLELVIHQKEATITAGTLPVIEAVPTQMHQLFYNLLTNALKFSNRDVKPQISINQQELTADDARRLGAEEKNDFIKIVFADNGIGFRQEYAEQIFSLFKRLHAKTEYEGTGIGLGLCKKIVQNHHGLIYATAELGKGATFHILLPKKVAE